jgi:hypothetical protein
MDKKLLGMKLDTHPTSYNRDMTRSVADDLREEQIRQMLELTPGERMRIAEKLGEDGLRFFMSTNGITREEAIRRIEQQRRAGRTPSRCMDER